MFLFKTNLKGNFIYILEDMVKKKTVKSLPSVAILTPSTFNRQHVLPLLAQCIESQTYTNIKEWVLIDGSRDGKVVDRSIVTCTKCPVRWVEPDGLNIAMLRQRLKDSLTTDIAVCFDDDDYYPPTRVSHAVERLLKTGKQIAGCTAHLVFDIDLGQALQCRGFHGNHATHNTMAFTASYARTHNYDPDKAFAEESHFTNKFSEPMVQLDYMHTILQMFHSYNTYNKREMAMIALAEQEPSCLRLWRGKIIAPDSTIQRYTEMLSPVITEVPDIVYYLGGWNPYKWEPTAKSLGGSEQAVVELCKAWVATGLSVHVYGDFEPVTVDGVVYKNWKSFIVAAPYKNLILWRKYGCNPIYRAPLLKAKRVILDIHDSFIPLEENELSTSGKIDHIAVKSQFHSRLLGLKKAVAIPNGIRTQYFNVEQKMQRDNFRCIYASDYVRGLEYILRWAWPVLKKLVPQATFDVYYGMGLNKKEFQEKMEPLLKQPGVTDHGRCSVDVITAAKKQSSFHLYFSNTHLETDCISIRESAAVGCLPVISSMYVFAERAGFHLNGDPCTKDAQENMAYFVANLMKNPDLLEKHCEAIASLKTQDWESTAALWTEHLLL